MSDLTTPKQGWLLFDWGDTLMHDFKQYMGKMSTWPHVEAMPGAVEALTTLHARWHTAIATNAEVSEPPEIRLALSRVDLDSLIDEVYCYRRIGHKKPAREYFSYILQDLQLPPEQVVMVGDSFENDVLGANHCGLRAIWLNLVSDEVRTSALYRTIHSLHQLPHMLESFIGEKQAQ